MVIDFTSIQYLTGIFGDVISWPTSAWNISGTEKAQIDNLTALCRKAVEKSYFVFPEWRTYSAAEDLCTVLGIKAEFS